jgi:hypothetical protein
MQTDYVLREALVSSYTQFMFNNLHECVLLNSKLFVENSLVHCMDEKKNPYQTQGKIKL